MRTERMLWLPGLVCDADVFADLIESAGPGAEVPDYRDCDSIEAMAARVIDSMGQDRLWLVGHSMGGRVALEVCRQRPDQLRGLVLMSTGFAPLAQGESGALETRNRMELLNIARTQGMRAMGEKWVRGMIPARLHGSSLEQRILAMIERHTPDQFGAQLRALLARPDAGATLESIAAPTLLLCGEEDGWSPLDRHRQMEGRIPGSTLAPVPWAGHMLPMEAPAAVAKLIADWKTRHDDR